MKTLVCAVLCGLFLTLMARQSPPKVQVYSHYPGFYGKDNVLICHVSGFQPPEIKIDILKNGQVIPKANQTDLAFEDSWQFHLTKSVAVKPQSGEEYKCRVVHQGLQKEYNWELDE